MWYNKCMKNYCVYCHKNKINGKIYIGITCQKPENRWRNGNGYMNNKYFFRAIQKYKWHNFSHEILYANLEKAEAEQLEIDIIKEYDSTNPSKGYNIALGGNGTEKFTDDIKKKISNALKGHEISEETKQKISKSKIGKKSSKKGCKLTSEQIEKNRMSHLGQVPWNKGKIWSKSEKARFGGKAIKCVELNKVFRSAHEASEELNIDFSSICKCRRGTQKTAGRYHFIPMEDNNE